MMRQAKSAIRELKRLQAERREIESNPEACDRGERIEHITTVLLNEGLNDPEAVIASTARRQETLPRPNPQASTPAPASPDLAPPQSVSSHDPETRKHKNETTARFPDPPGPAYPRARQTPLPRTPLPDWPKRPEYEPADG